MKMWRCEDAKIWRCEDEDVKMKMRRWRWEDEDEKMKMRRCEDLKIWRCEDVKMWRCEDVKMWRCEERCEDVKKDVKMWRFEDAKIIFKQMFTDGQTDRETFANPKLLSELKNTCGNWRMIFVQKGADQKISICIVSWSWRRKGTIWVSRTIWARKFPSLDNITFSSSLKGSQWLRGALI